MYDLQTQYSATIFNEHVELRSVVLINHQISSGVQSFYTQEVPRRLLREGSHGKFALPSFSTPKIRSKSMTAIGKTYSMAHTVRQPYSNGSVEDNIVNRLINRWHLGANSQLYQIIYQLNYHNSDTF